MDTLQKVVTIDHYDGKYQMGKVAKMDAENMPRLLGEQFPGHDAAARAHSEQIQQCKKGILRHICKCQLWLYDE